MNGHEVLREQEESLQDELVQLREENSALVARIEFMLGPQCVGDWMTFSRKIRDARDGIQRRAGAVAALQLVGGRVYREFSQMAGNYIATVQGEIERGEVII